MKRIVEPDQLGRLLQLLVPDLQQETWQVAGSQISATFRLGLRLVSWRWRRGSFVARVCLGDSGIQLFLKLFLAVE